ncbi:NAD-specific glutamate dehydrogenase [Dermatophilus congolensis]|uniref:NAD-specific glutamate dehydrogenase n=1 Tax=Dermatophilus congolensis TaxID=1863 RepID=A0A239VBV8_9MICO|nr:NAD-glutamate dehydrogenase [Dermatophilus congolensis]SNV18904.1 NAD-specific glutamate dehydrogenase [Dermatophilus congolensis]
MGKDQALRASHLEAAAATIAAAAHVGDRSGVETMTTYLERFYHHVATEELLTRTPEELAGAAASMLATAHQLTTSTRERVRVFTPTVERDGWASGHTVVHVATDDASFLVDSLLEHLEHTKTRVHFIAHPQIYVRRDDEGTLTDVVDVASGAQTDPTPTDALRESWIHIEIDRLNDHATEENLAAELLNVVRDVHAAVDDFDALEARAIEIRDNLTENIPNVDPDTVHRARSLLDWVAGGQFIFIGAADYTVERQQDGHGRDTVELRRIPESGLGILSSRRSPETTIDHAKILTGVAAQLALKPVAYVFTKANATSTVHRRVRLEYIGIKQFDTAGNVTGERRIIGLFTAPAYVWSVTSLPYVRDKVQAVIHEAGYVPDSHLSKDLLAVLESYPRDDLFHGTVEHITAVATAVVHLRERRRTRLFLRHDPFGRYVTALIYLPRDRYNTDVRIRIQDILMSAFNGDEIEYRTRVSDASLAQIYAIVHGVDASDARQIDLNELEARIVEATRNWDEGFAEAATARFGEGPAAAIIARYGRGVDQVYKADVAPRVAVADVVALESFEHEPERSIRPVVHQTPGAPNNQRRMKIYARQEVSLSDLVPILRDTGVRVTDERPYRLHRADGTSFYVYDIGLSIPDNVTWRRGTGRVTASRETSTLAFEDLVADVWAGRAESDSLNALVLRAGLTGDEIAVLRAITSYIAQAGSTFSRQYVEQVVLDNPELAATLLRYFEARFDPEAFPGGTDNPARIDAVTAIESELIDNIAHVTSLDEDTIWRRLHSVVASTVRTNRYAHRRVDTLAFKLHPAGILGIPEPVPAVEIWVYSPRVEGTHLRFGPVARGGLRWSDRREDFRTEILGLVKAQMVKNALIVPTGSKGGFYAKRLPAATDRDAWMNEGIAAYKLFVSSLLDVTDNRTDEGIHTPAGVLRYDEEDPYLVVAADKGTARFSDIANDIAVDYGFWLQDAFASGGSAGYDHKGMGITARGAWVSVQRHFRELGINVQTQDFTVVGIGDMSGDVFGNGMLLSEHIHLVAAFDHRHIFLDPTPDAAATYAERRRIFDLPRSSWDDFDRALLSKGGGIYPRTAKRIDISEQAATALGLENTSSLTPSELVAAILRAPVDLLWNGGIGTYVKATTQTNAEIGDRANDAVRINGNELRARVVGEGGNLGLSQLGRIEAARNGVLLNTDAIDNAAGVNTSDHEVNIKILLGDIERTGDLTRKQRNELLESMTEEVAAAVLHDNYEQNVLLGNARMQAPAMAGAHARFMDALEKTGQLDRSLEFLPSHEEFAARLSRGEDLTSPEMSVLVGYAKISLKNALGSARLPDDPWLDRYVEKYFPKALRERYGDRFSEHPLRRDIIINVLVNGLVNRGGVTFVHRCQEETDATVERIVAAYVIASEVFGQRAFAERVQALDNELASTAQTTLHLEFRRLIDRAVRWIVTNRPPHLNIGDEIEAFAPVVESLHDRVPDLLTGPQIDEFREDVCARIDSGLPEDLARDASALIFVFSLLDIAEIAVNTGVDPAEVASIYYAALGQIRVGELLVRVEALDRDNRWDSLARQALRDDLYDVLRSITTVVLESEAGEGDAADAHERVRTWAQVHADVLSRLDGIMEAIDTMPEAGLAPVSVAVRSLRGVIRTTSAR